MEYFKLCDSNIWKHKRVEATEELMQAVGAAEDDFALLHLSIEKWKYIRQKCEEVGEKVFTGGIHTCALCVKYHAADCIGCPIGIEYEYCIGTPNEDYDECGQDTPIDDVLRVVDAEIEFLEDLLVTENNKLGTLVEA